MCLSWLIYSSTNSSDPYRYFSHLPREEADAWKGDGPNSTSRMDQCWGPGWYPGCRPPLGCALGSGKAVTDGRSRPGSQAGVAPPCTQPHNKLTTSPQGRYCGNPLAERRKPSLRDGRSVASNPTQEVVERILSSLQAESLSFFFFCFLGLFPRHMEVPRLGV